MSDDFNYYMERLLLQLGEIEAALNIKGLPHVIYKPNLSIDGNQWCALYGENLQEGVAGFGDSPIEALHAFDAEFISKLKKVQKESPKDE